MAVCRDELRRVRPEALETGWIAEVIDPALMLVRAGRIGGIDRHPADWIDVLDRGDGAVVFM
jgi:hypothetical protein